MCDGSAEAVGGVTGEENRALRFGNERERARERAAQLKNGKLETACVLWNWIEILKPKDIFVILISGTGTGTGTGWVVTTPSPTPNPKKNIG